MAELSPEVAAIPLLNVQAGPRDAEQWMERVKEEYLALIQYIKQNKERDNDWFKLKSNKYVNFVKNVIFKIKCFREGTSWFGTCWYIHEHEKYEFKVEFDIPVSYPLSGPEIALPELDGKTAKMYRGGKICLERIFAKLLSNCYTTTFFFLKI